MRQGEVYWISLNPTKGHEITGKGDGGKRPCVIVSPDILNDKLGTIIIAPCTSTIKHVPFRAKVSSLSKPSEVALDQVRTIDKSAKRFGSQMGKLSKKEMNNCLRILRAMFSE